MPRRGIKRAQPRSIANEERDSTLIKAFAPLIKQGSRGVAEGIKDGHKIYHRNLFIIVSSSPIHVPSIRNHRINR